MDKYKDVIERGTFYYPASRHYGDGSSVACDRCARAALKACIGYKNADLCMICVDFLLGSRTVTSNTARELRDTKNIFERGNFYYPASKHYGEGTSVACERCARADLKACIGYKNINLCMICVDFLLGSKTAYVVTRNTAQELRDIESMLAKPTLTRMRQMAFTPKK